MPSRGMITIVRVVVAIALVMLWATAARAQDVIALGDRASVRRAYLPCWDRPFARCAWWQPGGALSFGGHAELELATTFARAPSGRIFAMIPMFAPLVGVVGAPYPAGSSLLYTDDLGATWSAADWPDPLLPAIAIAFDPVSRYGVAVGGEGSVWSSTDEGLTWRRRRSPTGVGFRRVWVRARTCVIEDASGALWLSRDGGFALESLAPRGRVEELNGELAIEIEGRTTRVDAGGTLRRQ